MAIDEQAVRREVILPVDRETAWSALCDAGELATWLADEVDIEIRVGAEGVLRWRDGEQREAVIEELQELRRIALRWSEPGGEESIVELTLDDHENGTRLTVLELPVVALEGVGALLERGPSVFDGPRMVAIAA